MPQQLYYIREARLRPPTKLHRARLGRRSTNLYLWVQIRSGPRESAIRIILPQLRPWHPALRWPISERNGPKHLSDAASREAGRRRNNLRWRVYTGVFHFRRNIYTRVSGDYRRACMCGTCPERTRECELARRRPRVLCHWGREALFGGYVWKRMNKGEMNLLGSQAIGRRLDRRINSF